MIGMILTGLNLAPEPVAGMNTSSIIAIAALVIALLTFVVMQIGQRKSASTDYVSELEERIKALEKALADANEHIRQLEMTNGSLLKENMMLLRKIARLDDPDPPRRARK
jgi:hypothetical protein